MEIAFQNSTFITTGILNDYQFGLFEIINYMFLAIMISVFGIVGNIINILVFFKQGFANTVNISFFGLAISDICGLISLSWVGVWLNPFMSNSGIPVNPIEFQYLTGACPHVACGRITSYITVYVTAERCLCIFFPLKIKQLVTPTRTTTVVCSIFVVNILTVVPEYATSYLDWQFSEENNKTILAMAYRRGREHAVALVFFLYSFTGMLSFAALIIFTVTLAVKLQQSAQWRKGATSGSDQQASVDSKEKKTVKMIVVIATVLIVCYIPGAALSLTTFVEPEFYREGRYHRLCLSLWSFGFVFNGINSSVNIILYYNMSSNYRKTFNMMFKRIPGDSRKT